MAAAGTLIRDERDEDAKSVASLITEAFGRSDEARLVYALRCEGDVVFSLVAELEGAIVGHVLMSVLDSPMPALALAPLAVAPPQQRKGIGSALVWSALGEARERGWGAVFVLGSPAFYTRFGFDVVEARGYRCRYAGDHFMIVALRLPVHPHGQIKYPAAFDRFED